MDYAARVGFVRNSVIHVGRSKGPLRPLTDSSLGILSTIQCPKEPPLWHQLLHNKRKPIPLILPVA